MLFKETKFKGVYIIEPEVRTDMRGYFMESFRSDLWEEAPEPVRFIQENESFSRQGVLRGLHYQIPPYGQAKLIRVVRGAVLDVAVDMRPAQPTFGQYCQVELNDQNKRQLFIPSGFAHGFLTLSSEAVVVYKVDAPYCRESERSLRFDDPFLRIDWGVSPHSCILSDKDREGLLWEAATHEILNNS
ncbi:MAG: dTDP-4-dehydrorhamnose 3,5-epimerase [Bacteroidales bacterium]|nr:dTDP-4-dehydrorhamnose 3,5-epimerase [Bacteroidales bacterium]